VTGAVTATEAVSVTDAVTVTATATATAAVTVTVTVAAAVTVTVTVAAAVTVTVTASYPEEIGATAERPFGATRGRALSSLVHRASEGSKAMRARAEPRSRSGSTRSTQRWRVVARRRRGCAPRVGVYSISFSM